MKNILFYLLTFLPLLAIGQTNLLTLDGSASFDPDGTIVSYRWKLLSGPGSVLITDTTAKVTTVTGVPVWKTGQYKFQLKCTDNLGAVAMDTMNWNVTIDQPPIINGGADQVIQLPATTIVLTATVTDPAIDTLKWKFLSGPNTPTIAQAFNSATATVTNFIAGVYSFQFSAKDKAGNVARDTVKVTVNPANQAPVSNAGPDQIIVLPVNQATIGKADAPGLIIQWVKMSGPSGGTIAHADASITLVTALQKGDYIYRKIVRNAAGMAASDDVRIRVIRCTFIMKLLGLCPATISPA